MKADPIIELVTPKHGSPELDGVLERFARRYREILDHGFVVSLPDNPGALRFRAAEVIEELDLPTPAGQVLIHLNTFHTRRDLNEMLETALSLGVRSLLVVSGDGGERLPKLSPETLGFSGNTVTAVELLAYIRATYPDHFNCGVVFNPYELFDHEMKKLDRKIRAGAEFVITQPVIAGHRNVDALDGLRMPVFVGAWMSSRLAMFSDCVGYQVSSDGPYDALMNAVNVRRRYAWWGTYFCAARPATPLADIADIVNERTAARAPAVTCRCQSRKTPFVLGGQDA